MKIDWLTIKCECHLTFYLRKQLIYGQWTPERTAVWFMRSPNLIPRTKFVNDRGLCGHLVQTYCCWRLGSGNGSCYRKCNSANTPLCSEKTKRSIYRANKGLYKLSRLAGVRKQHKTSLSWGSSPPLGSRDVVEFEINGKIELVGHHLSGQTTNEKT